MTSGRVLYIGVAAPESTSRHRADALRRLGFVVSHLDPVHALAAWLRGLQGKIHYHTGYRLLGQKVYRWLSSVVRGETRFDFCWVDGGEWLDPRAVNLLRAHCGRVILFNHDDPTGSRDARRFGTLRGSVRCYDLCAVVRQPNVEEMMAIGARKVVCVWRSYDEIAHRPADRGTPVADRFVSDVAFLGRNFRGEGRDRFLVELIRAGIRPAIWGDNWQASTEWDELRPFYRGRTLAGADYVDAIRGSKVCLGMLSKGNRDQHTTRTMEIPYAGGLLCAERTNEHQQLYVEGEEAIFWSDVRECIATCRDLLADPVRRARVQAQGLERVVANRVGNEDLCRKVIAELPSGSA